MNFDTNYGLSRMNCRLKTRSAAISISNYEETLRYSVDIKAHFDVF